MSHTILIAEDDESLLKSLVTIFTEEGFKVLTAKNGLDCLDMALIQHPDLIVLD